MFNPWRCVFFIGPQTLDSLQEIRCVYGGSASAFVEYLFNQLQHSGRDPNTRGNMAVEEAKSSYMERGYTIIGDQINSYIDGLPVRRYDFVAYGPDGLYYGVEVKSSIFDNFKLNSQQVEFDTSVYTKGGATFNGQGEQITRVNYVGVGFGGMMSARWSSSSLVNSLQTQGISMTTQRGRSIGR